MKVRLTIGVNVHDIDALFTYAQHRYALCWEDDVWKPENVGEAVFEALVGSNANENPADYGIEIYDYEWDTAV